MNSDTAYSADLTVPATRRSTLGDRAFAVAVRVLGTLCLMRSGGAHHPTILNAH